MVRFYTLNELVSQLLNARMHSYEIKFIDSVKSNLIVIDELGYVPIKPEARFLLFELFAKLYEQFSLIITTHLRIVVTIGGQKMITIYIAVSSSIKNLNA